MSKRTQHNIGQNNKTSVKVHHQPGGQSNWSLGWGEDEKQKQPINKYRNQSNVVLGGQNEQDDEEQKKRLEQEKKKKEEELNRNLPSYDPRLGGKSSVQFGDEKKEKQEEVVKVRNPPGGRSNIQFG